MHDRSVKDVNQVCRAIRVTCICPGVQNLSVTWLLFPASKVSQAQVLSGQQASHSSHPRQLPQPHCSSSHKKSAATRNVPCGANLVCTQPIYQIVHMMVQSVYQSYPADSCPTTNGADSSHGPSFPCERRRPSLNARSMVHGSQNVRRAALPYLLK